MSLGSVLAVIAVLALLVVTNFVSYDRGIRDGAHQVLRDLNRRGRR